MLRVMENSPRYCGDWETTGLNPLKDRITWMSFAIDDKFWWALPFIGEGALPFLATINLLKPLFANPNKLWINHNISFDYSFLVANGVDVKNKMACTQVMSWLLDETRSRSRNRLALKGKGGVIDEEFGVLLATWAESELNKTDMEGWIPTIKSGLNVGKEALDYLEDDATWPLKVFDKLLKKIKKINLDKVFWDLEMPIVPIISRMKLDGIRVDVAELKKLSEKEEKDIELLKNEIWKAIGDERFNPGSSQQLSEYMFDTLKLEPKQWMVRGKSGFYSVDIEVLSEYSDKSPVIDLILKLRKKEKFNSTYLKPFIEIGEGDSEHRIHASFQQVFSATGRFTCDSPNLQNLPSKGPNTVIRKMFIAKPGFKIICFDYSQIELRILAHMSQDYRMMKVYREGGDIHKLTQDMLKLKDRASAKACNFGLAYGMREYTFQRNLWLKDGIRASLDYCKAWRAGFFETYPGVPSYHNKIEAQIKDCGYVKTITGRRRNVKLDHDLRNPKEFNNALRVSINAVIQGSAADIIKIAMRNFTRDVSSRSIKNPSWNDVKLIGQIHDELLVEVPDKMADEVSQVLKSSMEDCVKLSVPLVADGHHGKSWGIAKSGGDKTEEEDIVDSGMLDDDTVAKTEEKSVMSYA